MCDAPLFPGFGWILGDSSVIEQLLVRFCTAARMHILSSEAKSYLGQIGRDRFMRWIDLSSDCRIEQLMSPSFPTYFLSELESPECANSCCQSSTPLVQHRSSGPGIYVRCSLGTSMIGYDGVHFPASFISKPADSCTHVLKANSVGFLVRPNTPANRFVRALAKFVGTCFLRYVISGPSYSTFPDFSKAVATLANGHGSECWGNC